MNPRGSRFYTADTTHDWIDLVVAWCVLTALPRLTHEAARALRPRYIRPWYELHAQAQRALARICFSTIVSKGRIDL